MKGRSVRKGRGIGLWLAGAAVLVVVLALADCSAHAQGASKPMDLERQEDALRFDLGVGLCRFRDREGVFWQPYHAHQLDIRSTCGELGLSGDFSRKFGWFLRYVPFGRQYISSEAQSLPDDDEARADRSYATLHRAECHGYPNPENCQYRWNGGGNMNGIALGFSRNLHRSGKFRLDNELGLLFYRLKWITAVHPYGCADNCAWRQRIEQWSDTIETTPMLGLTVRYGDIYAGWRVYLQTSNRTNVTTPYAGPAHQFLIGVSL